MGKESTAEKEEFNTLLSSQDNERTIVCRPVTTTAGGIVEPSDLPDHVVLKMLHREVLLTKAKLHALHYEQAVAERKLRTLKSQLRQVRTIFLTATAFHNHHIGGE